MMQTLRNIFVTFVRLYNRLTRHTSIWYVAHVSVNIYVYSNETQVTAFNKDVCDPLKNFVSYDFLEMQQAKKKVLNTASECDSTRAKIDSAMQGRKRIGSSKTKPADPAQIAQVRSILFS